MHRRSSGNYRPRFRGGSRGSFSRGRGPSDGHPSTNDSVDFNGRRNFSQDRGRGNFGMNMQRGRGGMMINATRGRGNFDSSPQPQQSAFGGPEMSTEVKDESGTYKPVERRVSKMGRIIIRNLPFKTKEIDLRNLMGKCGKILEVRIPLKEDGKMRGFAFVQFQSINSAELAIKMFNASLLKERPIAVDWAVAKSRYEEAKQQRLQNDANGVGEEQDEKPDIKTELPPCGSDDKESSHQSDEESDSDSDDDSSSGDDKSDEESPVQPEQELNEDGTSKKKKKPRTPKKPSDVDEGRTLFIRNLSYDTTPEALRERFIKFGVIRYALLNFHNDSGHAKGSGFVQFRSKDDADNCVRQSHSNDGILLDDRKLLICVAENAKQRVKSEKLKHEKPKKDSRNLFLLKEGQVRKEEEGVDLISQNDQRKRSMLDKKKADALKNLHKFVSTTRLSVHNIPKNIDDVRLRQIFLEATGLKKYAVKESRIIRDLQHMDSDGVGKSRGFGFVEFKRHEDAVKAVHAVNNNATIFRDDKRPIVEFALEDKSVILKKQKRLEHSQAKLQMLQRDKEKHFDATSFRRKKDTTSSNNNPRAKPDRTPKSPKLVQPLAKKTQPPGLKRQSEQTATLIKAPRIRQVDSGNDRMTEPKKRKRENKKHRNKNAEENDDFGRLVDNYKAKLKKTDDSSSTKTLRWFDE